MTVNSKQQSVNLFSYQDQFLRVKLVIKIN